MKPIAVVREGQGAEVLLVHGGAAPATTWAGLERLSQRWTLAFAYRRGYPPSPPPPGGHQDFELDAEDVGALLDRRPHVVAHSYGGLAAMIAASRFPGQVRSLTLIEPALYMLSDDPEAARFHRLGDEVLAHGLSADPAALREFLRLAGAPVGEGPLPEQVARGVRRAHGGRSPGEARPQLELLRRAQIPMLVASGGHAAVLEKICDALARTLNAQRLVAPGAGHFVAGAPRFAQRLERFLLSLS